MGMSKMVVFGVVVFGNDQTIHFDALKSAWFCLSAIRSACS